MTSNWGIADPCSIMDHETSARTKIRQLTAIRNLMQSCERAFGSLLCYQPLPGAIAFQGVPLCWMFLSLWWWSGLKRCWMRQASASIGEVAKILICATQSLFSATSASKLECDTSSISEEACLGLLHFFMERRLLQRSRPTWHWDQSCISVRSRARELCTVVLSVGCSRRTKRMI